MLKRLQLRVERTRASLFFVPTLFVIAAVGVAGTMLRLDAYVAEKDIGLPFVIQTTPESARSLLGTVASATITVAGVVFAITLISIQLAASQFSPRIIPGFLRDSRQQRVMGLAVGTFSYSLIVLRGVRGSSAGDLLFVPHLSSALSLVLAIGTIVGLIGFLDRSARTMQVGQIVHRLTEETTRRIDALYPDDRRNHLQVSESLSDADATGATLRATANGWVCQIDRERLLERMPARSVVRLEIRHGSFVAKGQAIGTIWPPPEDPDIVRAAVTDSLVLGDSRMLMDDVAFGIRQLVDIGLRALSPGVHDPTTAYDVIVHLGVVVRGLLWRTCPRARSSSTIGGS